MKQKTVVVDLYLARDTLHQALSECGVVPDRAVSDELFQHLLFQHLCPPDGNSHARAGCIRIILGEHRWDEACFYCSDEWFYILEYMDRACKLAGVNKRLLPENIRMLTPTLMHVVLTRHTL